MVNMRGKNMGDNIYCVRNSCFEIYHIPVLKWAYSCVWKDLACGSRHVIKFLLLGFASYSSSHV